MARKEGAQFLEGAAGRPLGPEARYEQSEAISLAFVAGRPGERW